MKIEENEDPLYEKIPYFGKLKDRNQKKMKKSKIKERRPLSGTLFKIYCWTYEVIEGDPMPIRQQDIAKATNMSIGSVHHAWNDKGVTGRSLITNIVTNMPKIVKRLIDKKYYHLSPEEREELLRKAPMLTEEELDEQTKQVIEF